MAVYIAIHGECSLTTGFPTKAQGAMGVIWLGGAAIRAGYALRLPARCLCYFISALTMVLREVLADQSDRGHRANVQKLA